MRTIALELVPTNVADGQEKALEEVGRVAERARAHGLLEKIGHVMIPGMIVEDPDRPVEMQPKLDTLDFWQAIRPELPGIRGLCTQVTAFADTAQLTGRLRNLRNAGIDGVVFVGVPRTMSDGEGPGLAPHEALRRFDADIIPDRGVVLIPTRADESDRFAFKCESGATFALTQLLYSDTIVDFLDRFARRSPHRPEILLSFGFVPQAESRVKLIEWLIKDPGNSKVEREQAFVAALATMSPVERRRQLVDLYARVVDGVRQLGFPISIHFEAPYGFSNAAFETFATMLDHWEPS